MAEEPSVLDYLKSKLAPWKWGRVEIPAMEEQAEPEIEPQIEEPGENGAPIRVQQREPQPAVPVEEQPRPAAWPWRSLVALFLALAAQRSLEPRPDRTWTLGLILYLMAAAWLIWAGLRGEWQAAPIPEDEQRQDPLTVNGLALAVGATFSLITFAAMGGNRFTPFNLVIWIAALFFIVRAFWLPNLQVASWTARLRAFLSQRQWNIRISTWTLLLLGVFALAIFFRAYHLVQVPPEMVSDHAEKLLDVSDVLNGQPRIYFPRNTGREGFQMYLTAAVSLLLGTGISFLSLKIGTVTCGLLTLPFIYLLGKEIGNRRVGLWAMAFAGIAYWPNLISRIALRFTLYPFFYAPMLYFLLRGLRTRKRNDFIWSGIFLGIGLNGYSPYRVVPIVVIVAVGLYLLHRQSQGGRKQAVLGLVVVGLVSLVIFLPLLRYALENPQMFDYRAMTRLGTLERSYPGPPLQIFFQNLWNALTMFAWDNGEVWVISVVHRPILDVVSGALFHLGVVLLVVRYLRKRHWLDLFILVSIPLLMMPSILSLAFPAENPSLNRTAAALVPVFLIVGIALDGLLSTLKSKMGSGLGPGLAWGLGIFLLVWSSAQNYDLVFNQYEKVYQLSSWNTSEMGRVARDFADSFGSPDTTYLVAYPYWVDSRLVAINAGYPTRDFALWPDHFQDTLADPRAKLFLINPQDNGDVITLRSLYPKGVLEEYTSQVPTKNFLMFIVPPNR